VAGYYEVEPLIYQVMEQGIKPARTCSLCGKPIEGSLTGWMFNRENCACPTPVPVASPPSGADSKGANTSPRTTKPLSSTDSGSRRTSVGGSGKAEDLQAGQIIADRYEVISLIGRGAMGSVYRVDHLHMQKKVALKVLNKMTGSGSNNQRRFQNEAVAAGRLDHPNLVRAIDFGFLDEDQPYIVMELVQGETLADYLHREGRMTTEMAADLFIPLCLALSHAHQEGIIHRDIKPGNIMLASAGSDKPPVPKLVDFGIAKLILGEAGTLTQAGEIFGTPFYMSPEQCDGSPVDKTSDIYSLGCVLYETLTGTPPFTGTPIQAMVQHRENRPASLKNASLGLNFHEGIESITFKMMAKSSKDRYQDCIEVAQDLAAFRRGDRINAPVAGAITGGGVDARKRAVPVVVACVAVLSAGVLGARLSLQHHDDFMPVAAGKIPVTKVAEVARTIRDKDLKPLVEDTDPLAIQPPRHKDSQSPENFSHIEHGSEPVRIYDFGDLDLGTIGYQVPGQYMPKRTKLKAHGTVALPTSTNYIFWEVDFAVLCDNPRLLYRFGDDELAELRLRYSGRERMDGNIPARVFDDTLTFAAHLKSLQSLDIAASPVSMSGLDNLHIDDLTKLCYLNISDTGIDGAALAKHTAVLKRLKNLDAKDVANARLLLKPLENSEKMESLTMVGTGMTDSDLAIVETIPRLRNLDIRKNPAITNSGVKSLRKMQTLWSLRLPSSVTPEIATSLAALKNLKAIELEVDSWTPQQIAKVKEIIPKVQIQLPQVKNEQLWSKRAQMAKEAREALSP
jgi:hypothetical protein